MARMIELEGYSVRQTATAKGGLKELEREQPHVVISDVRLPDGNGVDLTLKIKQLYPNVEVVVLTAFGTIQDGVTAIKNGAFDYLTKGEHQEKIFPLIHRAAEKAMLQQKIAELEGRLQDRFGFANILGSDPGLKQCVELAKKVAATDSIVLLLGETGVGKEVFAQAIHYESPRRNKPMVALNCSAFAKDLLESELFGHAEGAFTGATKAKKGLIEEAHGGTLFLDEIGELNHDLQAKLLRSLESGEFYRVGDTKIRKADVRIIAATNRNLEDESESGNFRKDLFYRLSVFVIHIPSLQQRKGDIESIANYFIQQFATKTNKRAPKMTKGFLDALLAHPWKGNIRELKNVIERSVIMAEGELLEVTILPFDFVVEENSQTLDLAAVEKKHIQKVLTYTKGNKTQSAKLLGIGLTTLYQKIKDYHL